MPAAALEAEAHVKEFMLRHKDLLKLNEIKVDLNLQDEDYVNSNRLTAFGRNEFIKFKYFVTENFDCFVKQFKLTQPFFCLQRDWYIEVPKIKSFWRTI
ncbi:MAG: hypothetical protein JWM09_1258 [Francisellaceae bacterium]|nr:hypothetical protein [Francisellaceae bacterium]